eukprot:6177064-Pleurochrysis_carterae.AAC.2
MLRVAMVADVESLLPLICSQHYSGTYDCRRSRAPRIAELESSMAVSPKGTRSRHRIAAPLYSARTPSWRRICSPV